MNHLTVSDLESFSDSRFCNLSMSGRVLRKFSGISWAVRSNKKYEGAICSIYKQQITSTVPLYLYSNGKKQRLSVELLPADTEWQLEKELGYVYASPVEGAIPLYEAENKNDYCYTTEDKQEYGTKGSWKQKGIVCYTMPL